MPPPLLLANTCNVAQDGSIKLDGRVDAAGTVEQYTIGVNRHMTHIATCIPEIIAYNGMQTQPFLLHTALGKACG